ncbi:TolC family protein [Blastopirellula retiformator]|uniref:Outer membrane efflux protein n=1 Tax=Blastopirellula retiformator TaxID=2527970 RepID=A0A5C5UZ76_9BACT|nr:TolC family protein [Blastopirellula retiformator]TWT30787.1 Outer membrane efflux protein [Blastopirellula retiformator]
MSRHTAKFWAIILIGASALTGCHPTQPFYFTERNDLSTYLDHATDIEYPDVCEPSLAEVENAAEPFTLSDPFTLEKDQIWELSLEDAVQMSLKNSKVLRTAGGNAVFRVIPGTTLTSQAIPTSLITRNDAMPTIYDPSIVETDPTLGVEGALSEFDAQLNMTANYQNNDRPQNFSSNTLFPSVFEQNLGTSAIELTKKSATGTTWFLRNNYQYEWNNRSPLTRPLPSDWQANIELEARHPLLRGSGVQVNRVNVMLARVREDVSLADFETNVRNLVSDVEESYWQLYFSYHNLEAAKTGRDSALVTWRRIFTLMQKGAEGGESEKEAQARQQYYEFRARTQAALRDLYKAENQLRYFMGIAANDGRLIRPSSEPSDAWVKFDWFQIHEEAIVLSAELRRQRWRLKQREIEMIAARNQLLPQLDVVGLYRFLGVGDKLISGNSNTPDFPAVGSTAWSELTGGNYQEWTLGAQYSMPIGFRQELAGVRNAQLRIAREKAVLEDMELEVSHLLTDAVRDLDSNYNLVQSNLNRLIAADKEVDSVQAAYDAGTVTLDLLLEAQRRRSEAQIAYFQSLVEYNIAIKDVQLRKGTLLEYNGIFLAEGPWPDKAYFDAKGHARRRAASHYMNYGYTRPAVISRGPVPEGMYGGEEGIQWEEAPLPGQPYFEEVPTPAAEPTPVIGPLDTQAMAPAAKRQQVAAEQSTIRPVSLKPIPQNETKVARVSHQAPAGKTQPVATKRVANNSQAKLDFNKLGLSETMKDMNVRSTPTATKTSTSANHEPVANPTPAATSRAATKWTSPKR